MNEKTIKGMQEMLKRFEGGAIQPDELQKTVEILLGVIKEIKTKLEEKITDGDVSIVKLCEKMIAETSGIESKISKKIELAIKDKATKKELESKLSDIYSSIESLKESIPEMPEMEEYEEQLEEIKKSIPEIKDTILDTPQQIRDKLETLKGDDRLDKSAIRGLEDELKRIEATRGGGTSFFGGRQMRMVSFTFTGDGVTTDFLLPAVPGAKGLAIWAYYQGQYQQLNTHYTVSNKTLTTVGWTPAVDSVLEGYLII